MQSPTLSIPRLSALPFSAADVPVLLDNLGVAFQPIGCVNWPADYPYCPDVAFRMAWCPEGLVIHYRVDEQSVRAHYGVDDGNVWTDSCVECFIRNADADAYYNIECNCIGTILVGVGPVGDRHRLSLDDLKQVKRWASLGNEPFEYREEPTAWEVALVVPSSLVAGLPLCLEPDATLRANFYKCGDDLRVPHFVSWSPIGVERPNFHKPEFFGHLHLQA